MGYIGNKYSQRAAAAKVDGKLTLSEINKSVLNDYNINLPVGFFKWLLQHRFSSEWHHTGSYFNETYFYDLEEIKEDLEEISKEELEDYKVMYTKYKENIKKEKANLKPQFIKVKYIEWNGNRIHPVPREIITYAIELGPWIYIDKYTKKKATGIYIYILARYNKKPDEMDFETIKDIMNEYKIGGIEL